MAVRINYLLIPTSDTLLIVAYTITAVMDHGDNCHYAYVDRIQSNITFQLENRSSRDE